jgi:hypothetical protein
MGGEDLFWIACLLHVWYRKRSRQEWEQEGNKALLENIGKIALFWQYSLILHYFQKPNNNLEVAGGTLKRM